MQEIKDRPSLPKTRPQPPAPESLKPAAPGRGLLGPLIIIAAALLLFATEAFPEETVSVPWPEFRALFEQNLERKFEARQPKPPLAQVHTLDSAVYRLAFKDGHVQGRFILAGRVLEGGPEAIPLFQTALVIDTILNVSGGHLLCRPETSPAIVFYPAGPGPFTIEATFLAPLVEDHRQGTVSFAIPKALNNIVHLGAEDLPRLLSRPGIQASDGGFRFAACDNLTLKVAKADAAREKAAPKVDLFSTLRWESGTLLLETFFWPRQPLPVTCEVRTPRGFSLVSTSLATADLHQVDETRLQVHAPSGAALPFSIIQARRQPDNALFEAFVLPFIPGNSGSQGNLVLEQPHHHHIRVAQPADPARLPLAATAEEVQAVLGPTGYFLRLDPETPLTLAMRRFREISVPPIVLDTVAFYTAVEENGNQLSTLVLDVPADAGSRLAVKAAEEARIWRLLVNGTPRNVFSQEDGTWMIPLDSGQASHVELAVLTQGDKLGLQGRLSARIPATGLPCQRLVVGIALPERVDLLSVEGAVSPAVNDPLDPPASFLVGRPYYFTRAFYKGESLSLAVAYKEPVKHMPQ